jgi:hypothetical protein
LTEYSIKENSWIAKIAAKKLRSDKIAIVVGKTIHLYKTSKKQFLQNERWLKHELCHIKQFQENGYLLFIAKYLWESIKHGYHNNKYEVEAREAEELE